MTQLTVSNAQIFYDGAIEAVRDVSFTVPRAQVITILGANGSGKSTLLKAISGILQPEKGALVAGNIQFDGADLSSASSES